MNEKIVKCVNAGFYALAALCFYTAMITLNAGHPSWIAFTTFTGLALLTVRLNNIMQKELTELKSVRRGIFLAVFYAAWLACLELSIRWGERIAGVE